MEPSREARELLAARVLSQDADALRAALSGQAPALVAWPDARSFAADALSLRATEPARALLFTEAHVATAVRRTHTAYLRAWRASTFTLRGESVPEALETVSSVVATETSLARREGLVTASDVAVRDLRRAAREAVEALRAAAEAVGPEAMAALGAGDAGADAVLAATEDIYRELDTWACRALEIDRTRLSWAGRLRSMAIPVLPVLVPPATWTSVGSRWMVRAGLENPLRRVLDDLRPAARAAVGVVVLGTEPGHRAVIAGRPTVAGTGALDVSGALGEALAHGTGGGITPGERCGADRAVFGLARALGRGLYLDRHFLRREAGLDVVPRERAMLEVLHAEVVRLRWEAGLARFTTLALARVPDLAGRWSEELTRAVGCAPTPEWAVHATLRAVAPDGRWGARVAGALAAPALVDWLRGRYDEDWFRNPRAGLGLTDALQDARTVGVTPWRRTVSGETDRTDGGAGGDGGAALGRRLAEALRDARRSTA